jgi:CRP/FNR family transcriptional regulator
MHALSTPSIPPSTAWPLPCDSLERDDLCLPCSLARLPATAGAQRLQRRRLVRGESLFLQGEPFQGIQVVRAGSFKSVFHTHDGVEQVTGLHVEGDVLGLDGLARDRHENAAIALEDSDVLLLPQGDAAWWNDAGPDLQRAVTRLLSRELLRERRRLQLLSLRSAEARVAAFLHDVSVRMHARGYSACEFHLRLTREEIGSYLGLQLETVSRAIASLQRQRVLRAQGKHVRVLDAASLAACAGA